jgi:hypothetical protein
VQLNENETSGLRKLEFFVKTFMYAGWQQLVIPDLLALTHQYLWHNIQMWLINHFKAISA